MLPNLIVSGLQSSLFWEDKNANMAMFSEKIASLPASHIIVLPEMFTTGFTMQPKPLAEPMQGQTHIWLQQQAAKKKAIITGTVIIEEHNKYYNRLLWVLPTGETGIYDKKHLFAFAGENKAYSAGNKRSIATVGGWR
ncbi:MAG: nitrilase-related carbon-nitrogen hydrolase, partial [Chitinophagaceae bacterium]